MSSQDKPVKVGIAGLGRSGWGIHASACERLSWEFDVVAVADASPERRSEAEQTFGCKSYSEIEDLFADDQPEVIVIATPSHLHTDNAISALEAGNNVVVEKPMALSTEEADRLIRVAESTGRILAPFQNKRYDPTFGKVQEVIDSGRLGRIVHLRLAVHKFARRWDWQTLQKFGGGTLNNTGPHFIDQALQLFGEGQAQVFSQLDRTVSSGDADDHMKVILHGPGSPTVEVEITSCGAYPQDNWLVMGTQGGLRGTGQSLEWKWVDPRDLPERPVVSEPVSDRAYQKEELTWHEDRWEITGSQTQACIDAFYKDLYQTMRHGKPLEITPESVRRQIAVLETCHENNPLPSGQAVPA